MACKCKENRRKAIKAQAKAKAEKKFAKAAVIGFGLAVTDAAAKVVGIDNGEVEDERDIPERDGELGRPTD